MVEGEAYRRLRGRIALGDDDGRQGLAGDAGNLRHELARAAFSENDAVVSLEAQDAAEAVRQLGPEGDVPGTDGAAGDEEAAELVAHGNRVGHNDEAVKGCAR